MSALIERAGDVSGLETITNEWLFEEFFTGNGKPLFYIVSNKHGITSGNLTTNDDRFYYMTGTCSLTSKKLGLLGYTMEKTTVNNIIRGLTQ